MNSDFRIIALNRRWEHHTRSGGYDRLAMEMGEEIVGRFERSHSARHRLARALWQYWARARGLDRFFSDYRYEDWLAERAVLARAQRQSPDAIHVLYGDAGMELLVRRRALLGCALIATFHQPPTNALQIRRFNRFQKELRRGVDVAVTVARCQIPHLQQWLRPDRLVFVPHGIDTCRFVPGERVPGKELKLLTVGRYLRDFEVMRRVIFACDAQHLPVRFDGVIRPGRAPAFPELPHVRTLSGLAEDELIRLYQQADALFMPVRDATANNAILESLACGTPAISNAIGGVPDYVDQDSGWLFPPKEVDGIVELIAAMCHRREIASAKRAGARRKSLEFDWSRVGDQMRDVYQRFAGRSDGSSRPHLEPCCAPVRDRMSPQAIPR